MSNFKSIEVKKSEFGECVDVQCRRYMPVCKRWTVVVKNRFMSSDSIIVRNGSKASVRSAIASWAATA